MLRGIKAGSDCTPNIKEDQHNVFNFSVYTQYFCSVVPGETEEKH